VPKKIKKGCPVDSDFLVCGRGETPPPFEWGQSDFSFFCSKRYRGLGLVSLGRDAEKQREEITILKAS